MYVEPLWYHIRKEKRCKYPITYYLLFLKLETHTRSTTHDTGTETKNQSCISDVHLQQLVLSDISRRTTPTDPPPPLHLLDPKPARSIPALVIIGLLIFGACSRTNLICWRWTNDWSLALISSTPTSELAATPLLLDSDAQRIRNRLNQLNGVMTADSYQKMG
jgi:hypothetical protein